MMGIIEESTMPVGPGNTVHRERFHTEDGMDVRCQEGPNLTSLLPPPLLAKFPTCTS